MGRKVLAIVTGLLTGMLVVALIGTIFWAKYPIAENMDWLNQDDRNNYIANLPDVAFLIIIASHIIGAFLAGLIASLITRKDKFTIGIIAGFLLFVFVLITNFTYEYPKLYMMSDVFLTAIAGFGGAAFGKRRVV